MNALELHKQHPSLDFAPILRVIKYLGFDSKTLAEDEVALILRLYPSFEADPELVVGTDAVARSAGLAPDRLTELLVTHRHQLPYLGTAEHPMVPTAGIDMIRALADGRDPLSSAAEKLYTLTEMAGLTEISLASLSKYLKEHAERIPSRKIGKMRRFPTEAIGVFQAIRVEKLGKRHNSDERARRGEAAARRRYAAKLAEIEAEVAGAVEAAKELTRTLKRLSRQVRRARVGAESGSSAPVKSTPGRPRRTGGHRPDTIVAACRSVLAGAGKPLRVAEITAQIIDMGTPMKAKNPNVTVSSILSSYDDFTRVRRGYYELRAPAATPVEPELAAGRTSHRTSATVAPQPVFEQDPSDVLAGLRAAAASQERGELPPDDPAERDLEAVEASAAGLTRSG